VDTEVIIATDRPDLIIADTDIQNQDPFKRFKSYLKKFQLPFIWIGTTVSKETVKASKDINVVGAFQKPFDSKNIVALVTNYFNKKLSSIFKS
jgi:DNA-binding NtrC family response regulator